MSGKRIRICDKAGNVVGRDELDSALDAVNGKAAAHVARSGDVWTKCRIAEIRLDQAGVLQANRLGAVLNYTPAGPGKAHARKARRPVISTRIKAARDRAGWYLLDATRVEIWPDAEEWFLLQVTAAAKADAVKALDRLFTVKGGAA